MFFWSSSIDNAIELAILVPRKVYQDVFVMYFHLKACVLDSPKFTCCYDVSILFRLLLLLLMYP